MKSRESGMPEESLWRTFFAPEDILRKMELPSTGDVIDFGCGYGTFSIPAAQITCGMVHALDIDPAMVAATQNKAMTLPNLRACFRDFIADGSGLPDMSVSYAMLFNILHAENPELLLREAYRILKPDGKLGITHWNYNPNTPRGPSMNIRPRPDQCQSWAESVGFVRWSGIIELPPHHYGLIFKRFP